MQDRRIADLAREQGRAEPGSPAARDLERRLAGELPALETRLRRIEAEQGKAAERAGLAPQPALPRETIQVANTLKVSGYLWSCQSACRMIGATSGADRSREHQALAGALKALGQAAEGLSVPLKLAKALTRQADLER